MRRSGRTTRIIDNAIQVLFTSGEVYFRDHHYGECEADHRRACRFAFRILLRRLDMEHGGIKNFKTRDDDFYIKVLKP